MKMASPISISPCATAMYCQLPSPNAPNIDSLPAEMLEKIFSYLSLRSIMLSAWNVCNHWRNLANSMFLRNGLVLTDTEVPTECVIQVLAALPTLQSLRLESRYDSAEILQAVVGSCTELRCLDIGWFDFLFVDLSEGQALSTALLCVVRNCPMLTDLTIGSIHITNGLQLCQELGPALPNLCALNFNETGSWFKHAELSVLLTGCRHMKQFRATQLGFSNDELLTVVQRWGQTLRVLEINAAKLYDEGLAPVGNCHQLRELKLTFPGLVCAGTLQKLAGLSRLEKLCVKYAQGANPADWCGFFAHSLSSGQLRQLKLYSCEFVSDAVLAAIAANCPALEDLDLCMCFRATGVGVGAVLRRCPWLRRLELMSCSPCTVNAVLENCENASQLRSLDVFAVKVEENVLSKLNVALPLLTLIRPPQLCIVSGQEGTSGCS